MTKATLRGRVELGHVGGTSKSARVAPLLVTPDGRRLILRRVRANPLADPVLRKLAGSTIECTGDEEAGLVTISRYRVIAEGA
ncbi:MAG: hypothetical protein IPH30_15755 [Betaproteobacteria bacterium]|jgi:hypothetical protein|nr:hypothetical protein [Betaproteobacteria bacterium]